MLDCPGHTGCYSGIAMKRIVTFVSFGLTAVALFGCPIYGDDGYTRPSSACSLPTDCPSGSVCGSDGNCRTGDCIQNGCVNGYICKLVNGNAQCVSNGGGDGGGSDGGVTDSGPGTECMTDQTCVSSKGAGAKCLNGTCVAQADQCSDSTQCSNGYLCVQGVCTPGCSAQKPCPTGYSCDLQKGVCTGNPSPCQTSQQCNGGNVCVEGHCVNPCSNGTCGAGLVCVGGGCIPDQKPQFVCATEGQQDACKMGSLCLHHNCYIACDTDAAMSCKNADQFNMCKSVTTQSGTYSVCGSSSNLGSECDPTQGKNCVNGGTICIDGYCR